MNGSLARKGFRFQDLYILHRILTEIGTRFSDTAEDHLRAEKDGQSKFGIEVGTNADRAPDWDNVIEYVDRVEVIEAKSGDVSRTDRIAFWKRLRREAGFAKKNSDVRAILVVDPSAEDTSKWEQLANFSSTAVATPLTASPSRVTNVADLFAEAVWWLSNASEDEARSPAISPEHAFSLLSSFNLESITANDLEARVLDEIEIIFPDGLSDQLSDSVLGWLNRRATDAVKERRYFSAREILAEMKILQESAAFQSGTLERWKTRWTELAALFKTRARSRLGNAGKSISLSETQPDIEKQLRAIDKNVVVIGKAGSGKTALLEQFGTQAEEDGMEVLRCNADAVTEGELDDLFKSLRFKRAVGRLRLPAKKLCVVVDGLDETEIGLRLSWAKQLARFGATASSLVVVTIRDNAWEGDGVTRSHLKHWLALIVNEWSEQLVQRLVSQRWSADEISPGLMELIRQPLMLDLFWRTFIEAQSQAIGRTIPQTRHQLLSAFWQERLLGSSRYKSVGLHLRLQSVIAQAVSSVASFDIVDGDKDALNVLLSESVIIEEGRLIPRYRFRHPLLRDFALSLWCLAGENESVVAQRWATIRGGLQRHGALRAMFEALADSEFAREHVHFSRTKVVATLLGSHTEAPAHLAAVCGMNAPEVALDPASWSVSLQQELAPTFGTELLVAARLAGNAAWAQLVSSWPAEASWIDDRFPEELLSFTSSLSKGAVGSGQDSRTHYARAAAVKLREFSEHPRFVSKFEGNIRWLKMAAMQEIIPLVPDQLTLEWIEREVPVASWRTRGFLLDRLIYIAPVDAARTATVFRAAVGLKQQNGLVVLDPEYWSDSLMDHHAIEWSLEGKDGRRSLLREFPKEFMPVAFMLAEALQNREQPAHREKNAHGFVDDYRTWTFWSDRRDTNAGCRCVRAIQKRASELADSDKGLFISDVGPLFRSSASLVIQSVYLDIVLARAAIPEFRDALVERLLDGRLYHFSNLGYWLETSIPAVWTNLSPDEREIVLRNIDGIVEGDSDESTRLCHARFLAVIPLVDLSPIQRAIAATCLAEGFTPRQHPRERFREGITSPWSDSDYDDERIKDWPEGFDLDQLRILSRSYRTFSQGDVKPEVVQQELPATINAALLLLPTASAQVPALEQAARLWLLDALADILDKHHLLKSDESLSLPPAELVAGCANLSLQILGTYDYGSVKAPERTDVWHRPETIWFRALAIADASLVWPPARDDEALQKRFERILVNALASNDTGVQCALITGVRSWHWLHTKERAALYDDTVWGGLSSGFTLAFALTAVEQMRDKHRLATYRRLLTRDDIHNAEALAEKLGDHCGHYSMVVFTDIGRSSIAGLAQEVVENPSRFPLLNTRDARLKFFRSFVFAMKEVAKFRWDNAELVSDYGSWSLKIWRLLSAIREKRQESEGVVLWAIHWLEAEEGDSRDPVKLRVWWEHLLPLVNAVIKEGNRPDCFTLFFNLRDPKMYVVIRTEELLDSVTSLIGRLRASAGSGAIDLDAIDTANEDHNSWREILRNASEALETARMKGLLQSDVHLEQSRSLLAQMAAAPFNIDAARTALYHLQNASV